MSALYREVLGDAFDGLHPHVRAALDAPLAAAGVMDVVHGSHRLTRLLVRLMKLPAEGVEQPVELKLSLAGNRNVQSGAAVMRVMIWSRRIGRSTLLTRQFARGGLLIEQSGLGSLAFSLAVDDGALRYNQRTIRFLGIRLPTRWCPCVGCRVRPSSQGWHVEVTVDWQGHLICRYGGNLSPLSHGEDRTKA